MNWKGSRILVTGIDGFVGSHLAKALLERGADVRGLIRRPQPSKPSGLRVWGLAERIPCYVSDVADRPSLRKAVRESGAQWIFHLAAQTIVAMAEADVFNAYESNVRGTYNLIDCAVREGLSGVVFASSDKAYGQADPPCVESAPLRGGAVYDSSKASAELLARAASIRHGLALVVSRCSNIYGPGDFQFSRIVPHTCRALALRKAPVIRGDGRHKREFLYIDDAVCGYLKLAEMMEQTPSVRGEAFNFGTGEVFTIESLVRSFIEVSRTPDLEPRILGRSTPAEIKEQSLDWSKSRRLLNWRPETSLAEGRRRTLSWYEAHLEGGRQ